MPTVRDTLATLNALPFVKARRTAEGEFRITVECTDSDLSARERREREEACACYTEDAEDALGTGRAMSEREADNRRRFHVLQLYFLGAARSLYVYGPSAGACIAAARRAIHHCSADYRAFIESAFCNIQAEADKWERRARLPGAACSVEHGQRGAGWRVYSTPPSAEDVAFSARLMAGFPLFPGLDYSACAVLPVKGA